MCFISSTSGCGEKVEVRWEKNSVTVSESDFLQVTSCLSGKVGGDL